MYYPYDIKLYTCKPNFEVIMNVYRLYTGSHLIIRKLTRKESYSFYNTN